MKILRIIAMTAVLVGLVFHANAATSELVQAKFERTQQGVILQLQLTTGDVVQFFSKILPGNSSAPLTRYYVDISPLKLSNRFQQPVLEPDAEIKQIRWAQREKDKVRVVLDLLNPTLASNFRVERYADGLAILNTRAEPKADIAVHVDSPTVVAPVTKIETPVKTPVANTVNTSQTPAQPSSKIMVKEETVDSENPLANKKSRKLRIILDPGHGGDDPGAHGKKGTLEKNVTLEIALKVRKMLQKNTTYEIFMTREKDTTLQLLDRTKFANRLNGDLFVSIHANASPKSTSKGISTYFLNNADDQESLRVAMRENGELDPDVLGQPSKNTEDYYLEVMKASMVKNFHTTQSTDLARAVQMDMLKTLRKNYSDIVDLGVRSARFYVLTGATMPAILVETSFISHPEEEKRLASAKYQESLANAVVNGIDTFFKNRPEFELTHAVYLSEETSTKKSRTSSKRN